MALLAYISRYDVAQADVAVLISSLLSTPLPLHGEGTLPLPYIDAPPIVRSELIWTNALQIEAQLGRRHGRARTHIPEMKSAVFGFRPFWRMNEVAELLNRGLTCMAHPDTCTEDMEKLAQDVISISLEGFQYYQRYDRVFLMVVGELRLESHDDSELGLPELDSCSFGFCEEDNC